MPCYKTKAKKKGGLSQYRVVVNYTDSNGDYKQISRRVYGFDEAKAVESELIKKSKEKEITKHFTLQQLYDEYIQTKEHEVRTSSLIKTKSILANHVLNTDLKNRRIDKLTVSVLQGWKNELGDKDLKTTSKNNVIRELNTLLNYAVRMEYIPRNPLARLGKFKEAYFAVTEERIHYYTADQFKRYIAAAEESRRNLTDYACCLFFKLAFYTGLRKGELNALKWSDLEGNVLHVRRSICQKVKGYEETPPKNPSSVRDIKLPPKIMKLIYEHKALLEENGGWNEDMRICGGYKPIADTNLENHNAQYAAAAGLPHICIHDFRHSHATLLINEGVNILEVSRRLGHSDVKMTLNTYSHLYPSTEEATLQTLENI
jgi:integrase